MSGAAETAFSQAGAGFLLFVSLLSSFLLSALKPRECNWSWERASMTGEECSAHAWATVEAVSTTLHWSSPMRI